MTNSESLSPAATRAPRDKRSWLIDAARELLYRQGIERTTLADVAEASGVPLGNIYYYFRSKNDLVTAVVQSRMDEQRTALESFDALPSPKERLRAFIRLNAAQADSVAESGCPMGSLCTELDKRDDGLERLGAALMQTVLAWVQAQFVAMQRPDARELAVAFVAAYQGVSVLTNTLRDPSLLQGESDRLERWIDSL